MVVISTMRHFYMKKKDTTRHTDNHGFSLVELVVVIAIMAVLVGVLTPMFTSYLHKSRVSTDWANLKNYFDEIQADYAATGKYNANVLTVDSENPASYQQTEIHFLNGGITKMKDGYFAVTKTTSGHGYQIAYYCNKCLTDWDTHSKTCELILG